LQKEQVRSLAGNPSTEYPIVCDNLKRVYPARDGNPPKYAVKGFSLAVPKGECFGILGPNGAGKTSSIKMVSTLTTFLIFHISSLGVFLNWLEFWEC
jgi:ABC-type multidrug transport system ATPase subunit